MLAISVDFRKWPGKTPPPSFGALRLALGMPEILFFNRQKYTFPQKTQYCIYRNHKNPYRRKVSEFNAVNFENSCHKIEQKTLLKTIS